LLKLCAFPREGPLFARGAMGAARRRRAKGEGTFLEALIARLDRQDRILAELHWATIGYWQSAEGAEWQIDKDDFTFVPNEAPQEQMHEYLLQEQSVNMPNEAEMSMDPVNSSDPPATGERSDPMSERRGGAEDAMNRGQQERGGDKNKDKSGSDWDQQEIDGKRGGEQETSPLDTSVLEEKGNVPEERKRTANPKCKNCPRPLAEFEQQAYAGICEYCFFEVLPEQMCAGGRAAMVKGFRESHLSRNLLRHDDLDEVVRQLAEQLRQGAKAAPKPLRDILRKWAHADASLAFKEAKSIDPG